MTLRPRMGPEMGPRRRHDYGRRGPRVPGKLKDKMNLLTADIESTTAVTPTGLDWLDAPLNGGLRAGGSYLLSGAPGSNKTTLAVQAAANLAAQGVHVLLVLTEQTPAELRGILRRAAGGDLDAIASYISPFLSCELIDRTDELLRLLRRTIPTRYPDTKVIVVDSLQGTGVSSTSTKSYRSVYVFIDETKARGITTIAVAHITKAGQIAGPKSLEHRVDVAVVLRKTYKFRHMFIIKNRFGPEIVEPVVLSIETGRLEPCPHAAAQCASTIGYSNAEDEIVEIQVAVSIPRLGARPELTAPYLPSKRIKQLVSCASKLPGVDLHELSYAINAFVPSCTYRPEMDLPIAVALLSAYLQKPVPPRALFVGQVDLRLNIRSPRVEYLSELAHLITTDSGTAVDSIFIATGAAGYLRESLHGDGHARLAIIGVGGLAELLTRIWPGAIDTAKTKQDHSEMESRRHG